MPLHHQSMILVFTIFIRKEEREGGGEDGIYSRSILYKSQPNKCVLSLYQDSSLFIPISIPIPTAPASASATPNPSPCFSLVQVCRKTNKNPQVFIDSKDGRRRLCCAVYATGGKRVASVCRLFHGINKGVLSCWPMVVYTILRDSILRDR